MTEESVVGGMPRSPASSDGVADTQMFSQLATAYSLLVRPLSALDGEQALIVYEADDAPLTPEHGSPVRLLIPTKYFWKSAKWLRGIELSSVDKPGFWERYGYHNDADYWQEQRYGF